MRKKTLITQEYTGYKFNLPEYKYEYRLTAFVDIQAFVSKVEKDDIRLVLDTLDIFYEESSRDTFFESYFTTQYNKSERTEQMTEWASEGKEAQDKRITTFSDLVVISFKGENKYLKQSLKEMIQSIVNVQQYLLKHGVLIRGAITYDKLIHNQVNCVGSALNRAYHLEAKEVDKPRIIVDKKLTRFKVFQELCNEEFHLHYNEEENLWETNPFNDILQMMNSLDIKKHNYKSPDKWEFRGNLFITLRGYYDTIQEWEKSGIDKVVNRARWLIPQFNESLKVVDEKLGRDFTTVYDTAPNFYDTLIDTTFID